MCKDKQMFALIIAIFLSVLFITGWVFADRNVMDLINVTPILEMKNTASAPAEAEAAVSPVTIHQSSDSGICPVGDQCK